MLQFPIQTSWQLSMINMISLLLQRMMAQDCTVPQINTRVNFPDLTPTLKAFYSKTNITLKDEGSITKSIQNVSAVASVPDQTVTPVFKDGKLEFTYTLHVKIHYHTKKILPGGGYNNATKEDFSMVITLSPGADSKGLVSSQTYKVGTAPFKYQINESSLEDDKDVQLALNQYQAKQASQGPKTELNSKIASLYANYLSQLAFTASSGSAPVTSLPTLTIQAGAIHLAESAQIDGKAICSGEEQSFQPVARSQQLQIHRAGAESLRAKGSFNKKFDKSWLISKFFFSCYEMTQISSKFIESGICKFLTDRVTVECSVNSIVVNIPVVSSTQTCNVVGPSSDQQQAKQIFNINLGIDYNWKFSKMDELIHLLQNPTLKTFEIKVPEGATYAVDNSELAQYFVKQALLTLSSPMQVMHSKFPVDFKQSSISIENDVLKYTFDRTVQK